MNPPPTPTPGIDIAEDGIERARAPATPSFQIDPRTNDIVRTIPLGGQTKIPPCEIAATRNAVWVAMGDTACDTVGQ